MSERLEWIPVPARVDTSGPTGDLLRDKKLRVLLQDGVTRQPLANAVVMATAEFEDGRKVGLGVLQSNTLGYTGFDLEN
jgi:hypothetical protein